ncbi:hypothetical protein ANN_18350 [Periplaneta americana]|uniref:Medium-chain acyl-CoA ligase ACSF2, mitochondrial n=1 Tax=Periplaneta americana TaxID=6978 RepID=A0ABQ8SNH9_PERAM|nr:hypothetical protein ANN_18350 [Periplaneta americana]
MNELLFQADCLAAGLLKLGLSPGDRLAIWGPNSSEWYIARFAAARGGFIALDAIPNSHRLTTLRFAAYPGFEQATPPVPRPAPSAPRQPGFGKCCEIIMKWRNVDEMMKRIASLFKSDLSQVHLDPAYQPPQLLYTLNEVEVKAIISSEFYKNNSCYEILRTVIPELDSCPESGVKLQGAKFPTLETVILMSDKQYRGAYRLDDIMASADSEHLEKIYEIQSVIQPDDGCAIHFSSGTTGVPKGVLLSHHNIVNVVIILDERIDIDRTKEDKSVVATQFCHLSVSLTSIVMGLHNGATCVIPTPVFDARKTLEAIIQEKCSRISGTPSLYVDMITTSRDLGLKVTTLQVAIYTGAPCSKQLAMEIKETFNIKTLFPAYGLTEVAGSFISQSGDSLEKVTSTVGYVFDYVEVCTTIQEILKIGGSFYNTNDLNYIFTGKSSRQKGRMVPMGTPGELWVRGFSVMLGYWKDEERTRQFITREGWAKTGRRAQNVRDSNSHCNYWQWFRHTTRDEFVLQEDGYGRILGRLKDVIIRIGDKIFPAEMEEFFTLHPDILEAQVFGIPDERVGEEICAYLRVKEGTNLTEEDVRNYCKNKIPEYKVPRYIRFVKDFERTSVGKVQKFLLLKKLQAELNNTA